MRKNIKSGLKKTLIQKFTKQKYMSQKFRFCCSCVRVTLMQKGKCHFCNGDFILTLPSDNLHKVDRRAKAYESIS